MTGENEKVVDTLNTFLRGELSAVETYRQALDKLNNSASRTLLLDCHISHEQRVEKLRSGSPSWADSRPTTLALGGRSPS